MRRFLTRTIGVPLSVVALLVAGCSPAVDEPAGDDGPQSAADQPVQVAMASYDLAVGDARRLTAGLVLTDGGLLVGGEVSMTLFYFGEDGTQQPEQVGSPEVARFLVVPGLGPAQPVDGPQQGDGSIVGVYETAFDFDRPGRYGVGVVAQVDGESLQGTTTFDVAAATTVPDVGDVAPTVANPTVGSDVAPAVIDSRARDGGEVPDPQLHATTLESSLAAGRRAVVLLSTPVYCVSRFCGPITEQLEELAVELPEDVDTIHIEVWEDFEQRQLHPAAEAWIAADGDGHEPWLFVVGADGVVLGRWDNVADLEAVRALLAS